MAVFLGVHKISEGMDETKIVEGWENYKKSASEMGLKPLSAVVSIEKGFAHCQTEADSADQVRKAHENVAIPLEDVVEVKPLQ
ncbi:DUF4242 domain-containing protein [Candidatus Roizmanbacteria bacterium]|nr:DUF4242 domain-containing protein [Candidatus Roizmanbacteria bacterium]